MPNLVKVTAKILSVFLFWTRCT